VAVFTYGGTSLVQAGQRVTVAGVTGGTYNGTWIVSAVTSTTFTVLGSGFTNVAGSGGTFTLSAVGSFVAGTAAITPLVVQGAASQTANLQTWQDSNANILGYVGFDGRSVFNYLGAGGPTVVPMVLAQFTVVPNATTRIGAIIRGAASQTADLQQWQDSSAAVKGYVSSGGVARFEVVQSNSANIDLRTANSGGQITALKQTAAASNPGSGYARLYFRDGTTAGTLKLVVIAGAAGAETTILDNIPQ
jgi:hypothetical protein